jgi:Cytochrome C oxidase, cbb3-type, subunit III
MKGFFAGVVATLAALVIGVLGYLLLGMAEVRADIPPSQWEVGLMDAAVHASVRRRAPEVPNPVPPIDENLIAGAKVYLIACSGCHGTPGKPFGDKGPVLFPRIPEFPVVGTSLSEAQIFWVAKHGIRRSGMFAADPKDETSLWKAAAYLKRIQSLPPAVQSAAAKLAEAQQ